jgi:hypothetical protein
MLMMASIYLEFSVRSIITASSAIGRCKVPEKSRDDSNMRAQAVWTGRWYL